MSNKVEVKCKHCKKPFMARIADRRRGWGKFCSKSCKAKKQEDTTGQYKKFLEEGGDFESDHDKAMHDSTSTHGQDGTGGV